MQLCSSMSQVLSPRRVRFQLSCWLLRVHVAAREFHGGRPRHCVTGRYEPVDGRRGLRGTGLVGADRIRHPGGPAVSTMPCHLRVVCGPTEQRLRPVRWRPAVVRWSMSAHLWLPVSTYLPVDWLIHLNSSKVKGEGNSMFYYIYICLSVCPTVLFDE